MATREETAYPILRAHDVDYVLIIYGGLIGFSGDGARRQPARLTVQTSTSSSGWSGLLRVSGLTRSRSVASSLLAASTVWMRRLPQP